MKLSTASPANTPRQSVNFSAISIGVVAVSAPSPPAAMIQPLIAGKRVTGSHSTNALKLAIRHADTPSPIKPRPISNSVRLSPNANSPAPVAASSSSVASTRRGPNRSSNKPSGNWNAAKVRK